VLPLKDAPRFERHAPAFCSDARARRQTSPQLVAGTGCASGTVTRQRGVRLVCDQVVCPIRIGCDAVAVEHQSADLGDTSIRSRCHTVGVERRRPAARPTLVGELAMEAQFAAPDGVDPTERQAWDQLRRAAAARRLGTESDLT
jgi:hypothetical protein